MKPYAKTYLKFFGLTTADFIFCELSHCSCEAKDIHHIWARSMRKDLENEITNLMALCREHHIQYGDKKEHREYLIREHINYMNANGKN